MATIPPEELNTRDTHHPTLNSAAFCPHQLWEDEPTDLPAYGNFYMPPAVLTDRRADSASINALNIDVRPPLRNGMGLG